MKRIIAIVLALFIVTACADNAGSGQEQVSDSETGASKGEESTAYTADVPSNFNFNGYNFRIYAYPDPGSGEFWRDFDFSYKEESGDALTDAAYIRMRNTEDKLGIKFTVYNAKTTDGTDLRRTITANDYAYDISCLNPRASATLSQSNNLLDLHSISALDLEAPWWDPNCVSDLSINHKLYMVVGDIAITHRKSIAIILFNKVMAEDFKIADPYAMLEKNTWTIDAFTELARNASADLNNDGIFTAADQYGLNFYCNFIANGMIASGVKFVTKGNDDLPELTFMSEKTMTIWDKYTSLFYDTATCYSWSRTGTNGVVDMFTDNRALFLYTEFHGVESRRQVENDFGILPIPKYDEIQPRYYHCINPHVAQMISVPIYNSNPELTAYILDTLGAESKNILTPAYTEVQLKTKGSRDDESEASIDIILNSLTYDMGYIYDWGTIGQFTLTLVDQGKSELASTYAKLASRVEKEMNKAIDNYLKID